MEFVPAKSRGFRTTFIILLGIMACTLLFILPFYFYSFQLSSIVVFYTSLVGWLTLHNWRWFLALCGLPYTVLFFGRMLLWPWESPRFLLTQGRHHEASNVLEAMAAKNNAFLPLGDLAPLNTVILNPKQGGLTSIKSAGMIGATLTVSFLFFCQTFGYYGLTIWFRSFAALRNIQNLDPIPVFLLIGFSELPGLAMTTFLIERAGRRIVLMVNFIGSAICTFSLLLVETRKGFLSAFSGAYFFIVGCWATIYVSTPEMFPTTCRATSFSIAGAFGKLAGIVSPLLLGWLVDTNVGPSTMVGVVSGSFILAALTAALLMIETSGRQLVDN